MFIFFNFFSGHSRQGLKCRSCKINVHFECKDSVGRCLPKSIFLRRQKSTSEIEAPMSNTAEEERCDNEEIDQTYVVLKQAGELGSGQNTSRRMTSADLERSPLISTSVSYVGLENAGAVQRQMGSRNSVHCARTNPNSLTVGQPSNLSSSSSGNATTRFYIYPSIAHVLLTKISVYVI